MEVFSTPAIPLLVKTLSKFISKINYYLIGTIYNLLIVIILISNVYKYI